MNIVVLVKQVPDTWAEKSLDPADNTLDRASADAVLNELDEYAVEEALRLKEAHGGEVTVLTMGPDRAADAVRKALTMGADKAVHVCDDALHGSDALATSLVLARAIATLSYDLVVVGAESTDARMGVMAALLAERLGLPQLSQARAVRVDGTTVRVERLTESGHEVVEATLPAVVGVVEKINEPRYPSFKGIMAAKKKPLTTLTLADLDLEPARVGLAGSATRVRDFTVRPPRTGGTIVRDEGDGGVRLADFLQSRKLL